MEETKKNQEIENIEVQSTFNTDTVEEMNEEGVVIEHADEN